MIYLKLAYRNMKRSAKDYLIYVVTMSIAVAFLFAFHAIVFSQDLMNLSRHMNSMQTIIPAVSILVVLIVSWLVHYITSYMMSKRKKEFGLYMLFGMKRQQIGRMFLMEQMGIGFLTFVIGCLLGTWLYQILTALIMDMFQLPYELEIRFSMKALFLTFVYFMSMYLLESIYGRHQLKKQKIVTLLYARQQNEQPGEMSSRLVLIVFLISVFLGIAGFIGSYFYVKKILLLENMYGGWLGLCTLSIILSLLGIYMSFAQVFQAWLKRHPKQLYQKQHLILYRQILSKMKRNEKTIAFLSLLSLVIIVLMSVGIEMKNLMYDQVDQQAPWDVVIASKQEERNTDYLAYLQSKEAYQSSYTYQIYQGSTNWWKDMGVQKRYQRTQCDTYMGISDYNVLRKQLSLAPITLDEHGFLLHISKGVIQEVESYVSHHDTIQVDDETLYLQSLQSENFAQERRQNGSGFIFVVADDIVQKLPVYSYNIIADMNGESEESWWYDCYRLFEENHDIIDVRGHTLANAATSFCIMSFAMLYLAFMFICVEATLLSVHVLSLAQEQLQNYELLKKMGMRKRQLDHIIFRQVCYYFLFPLLLPLLYGGIIIYLQGSFFHGLMQDFLSMYEIFGYFLLGCGLYVGIFSIYFFLTYYSFKKSIVS